MDSYSSPYIIPNNSPYNPLPHSLLSTRELRFRVPVCYWHVSHNLNSLRGGSSGLLIGEHYGGY